MARKIHLCMSVRGALQQTDKDLRSWCGNMSKDGKRLTTVREIRAALLDELAEGHEYLPIGECDNFDPKKGCLGHTVEG